MKSTKHVWSLGKKVMSFDKTGYQHTLFSWQLSTAGDTNRGNGSVQTKSYIIVKLCVSLKDLELTN